MSCQEYGWGGCCDGDGGIAAVDKGWNFHETYDRKVRQQLLRLAGKEH